MTDSSNPKKRAAPASSQGVGKMACPLTPRTIGMHSMIVLGGGQEFVSLEADTPALDQRPSYPAHWGQ